MFTYNLIHRLNTFFYVQGRRRRLVCNGDVESNSLSKENERNVAPHHIFNLTPLSQEKLGLEEEGKTEQDFRSQKKS